MKKEHPDESLRACARFDDQVHLTQYCNRAWVETFCGQAGPVKLHALVFKLPRESVECATCLRLAGLKKEVTDGVQQGMGAALR